MMRFLEQSLKKIIQPETLQINKNKFLKSSGNPEEGKKNYEIIKLKCEIKYITKSLYQT